jgi:hypothetical protein
LSPLHAVFPFTPAARRYKKEKSEMRDSFPSPLFAQTCQSAQIRIGKAKADLETLESRLGKIHRNREALEVAGRDPAAEIKRTRDEIRAAETELAHARQELVRVFFEESTRAEAARNKVWEAECLPLVEKTKANIAKIVAALREISQEIAALKSGAESVRSVSVATFDAGIVEFNSLAAKYGAPGNCTISPTSALVLTSQSAIAAVLKSGGLEQAVNELRASLNLDPVGLETGYVNPAFDGKSAT